MVTNENAANSESSGRVRPNSFFRVRRSAAHQQGALAAYITAQVEGLRYPSGICKLCGSCA
jgi:hypothetical protein